jgi:hypothetical protein
VQQCQFSQQAFSVGKGYLRFMYVHHKSMYQSPKHAPYNILLEF